MTVTDSIGLNFNGKNEQEKFEKIAFWKSKKSKVKKQEKSELSVTYHGQEGPNLS